MISLPLAKKIKESGFPQEPFFLSFDSFSFGGSWYYLLQEEACAIPVFVDRDSYRKGIEEGDSLVKIPSCEELLSVCRNFVVSIWKTELGWCVEIHTQARFLEYEGETLEEALVNVILSLKEQK